MELYTTIQNVMDLYYVDLAHLEQKFFPYIVPG